MNVTKLWMIARNLPAENESGYRPPPKFHQLETVRVNGELGLPLFTTIQNAERYVQTEKCLGVEIVQPADSVVGMAGFLQNHIEFSQLVCLVMDAPEATATADVVLAKEMLAKIIAELDGHEPEPPPGHRGID